VRCARGRGRDAGLGSAGQRTGADFADSLGDEWKGYVFRITGAYPTRVRWPETSAGGAGGRDGERRRWVSDDQSVGWAAGEILKARLADLPRD
jgi:hypothetical protein